jgi:hypothetical protein
VAVAQSDDPAVVTGLTVGQGDCQDAKVTSAIVTEAMALRFEGEAHVTELGFDLENEVLVGKRKPGIRPPRSWDRKYFFASDLGGTAMQQ